MFEVAVFCVIALAVAYCAMLWMFGRRDDVIFGQFVQIEQLDELSFSSPSASSGFDLILKALNTSQRPG